MDIERLIAELTVEEKAALVSGTDFMFTNPVPHLGVPSLRTSDGPHGLRVQREGGDNGVSESEPATAFPTAAATASGWDPENTRRMGEAIAAECRYYGVHVLLGPGVNIKRDPTCGRNFEYFSEDPLVSGLFAAALTNGVQAHPGCGTTVKHFAANNQETNRYNSNSQVSERAMREIYLRGFQICVRRAQPHALMTSYNLINGVHASEREDLIEGILRCEFGFKGIVMTDWVINGGTINKTSRYPGAEAWKTAAAGSNLFMPGSKRDWRNILSALHNGDISRECLETNAEAVIRKVRELAK